MIIPLDENASQYIAHHLRWTWAREVSSVLQQYGTPEELTIWANGMANLRNLPGETICVAKDGVPAVMGGIIQHGHVGSTWLAGTEAVDDVSVEFMRGVLRLHRNMIAKGVRRFVASVLDGPDELFSWLLKMGYNLEGRHPGVGVHGETFLTFGKVV